MGMPRSTAHRRYCPVLNETNDTIVQFLKVLLDTNTINVIIISDLYNKQLN